MKTFFHVITGLIVLVAAGCGSGGDESAASPTEDEGGQEMAITLTSSAFAAGESIPPKYTCDGDNVSPPLEWGQPPVGTKSLALIMDDPDAPSGTFVHWVYYDLPADVRSLPEGVSKDEKPSQGGTGGKNGANGFGYTGPCPPSGSHRYFFRLYALDTHVDPVAGLTKDQLLKAMADHILAQGELMGIYSRSQ